MGEFRLLWQLSLTTSFTSSHPFLPPSLSQEAIAVAGTQCRVQGSCVVQHQVLGVQSAPSSWQVPAQISQVLLWGLLCRTPALHGGTGPHTRAKLIQQQRHQVVLFFILLLLSPHEAASLNSYFITGCHERSFIKEGCEGRDRARLTVIRETQPVQRQQLSNSNTNWPTYGNPKDPALKTAFEKKMVWSVG